MSLSHNTGPIVCFICKPMSGVIVHLHGGLGCGVGVYTLPDTEIIVMAIPTIALEFVGVAYAEDVPVLADVLEAVIIAAIPAIDADMLAGENVSGLAAP